MWWFKHQTSGKAAPVDVEPRAGGNVAVDLDAGTYAIVKPLPSQPGYTSHFATCPNAKEWRR